MYQELQLAQVCKSDMYQELQLAQVCKSNFYQELQLAQVSGASIGTSIRSFNWHKYQELQ